MSDIDIRTAVQEELGNIAPEVNLAVLDPAADLREALDIESMYLHNIFAAIDFRLGVNIPEIDYPKLLTLNGAVNYLRKQLNK